MKRMRSRLTRNERNTITVTSERAETARIPPCLHPEHRDVEQYIAEGSSPQAVTSPMV